MELCGITFWKKNPILVKIYAFQEVHNFFFFFFFFFCKMSKITIYRKNIKDWVKKNSNVTRVLPVRAFLVIFGSRSKVLNIFQRQIARKQGENCKKCHVWAVLNGFVEKNPKLVKIWAFQEVHKLTIFLHKVHGHLKMSKIIIYRKNDEDWASKIPTSQGGLPVRAFLVIFGSSSKVLDFIRGK